MNSKYLIADLLISVESFDDDYFSRAASPYAAYTGDKADISITAKMTDEFIANEFTTVTKIGESQYFHEGESCDTLIFYDEKLCRIVAKVEFNKSYDEAAVTLCNLKKLCGVGQDKFLFNVLGVAMHYIIRMKNGFILHSSAIAFNGEGIAFSAESGIGKSTHTSLWIKYVGKTVIINDDTPVIRVRDDGEVYIYGTPWAGTSGINANISVPLKAIVFINRARKNKMLKISSFDAIKPFLAGVRAAPTRKMHIKSLDTLSRIFKSADVYTLMCNTKAAAAFTVKKELMK